MIKSSPGNRIVIDHLGTPLLEDLGSPVYWEGMEEFAKLENVYIKISFLCRIDKKWWENPKVIHLMSSFFK